MPFLPMSLGDKGGKIDAGLSLMAAGFSVLLVAFHDEEGPPVRSTLCETRGNVILFVNTALEESQDHAMEILCRFFTYPAAMFAPPSQEQVASHTVRDASADVWRFMIAGLYRPN